MKNRIYVIWVMAVILLLTPMVTLKAQDETFKSISGSIINAKTEEPLELASVGIVNTNISTVTNQEGNFNIKIPNYLKNAKLEFSFLGFKSQTEWVTNLADKGNVIKMEPIVTELSGVSLSGPKSARELVVEMMQNKSEKYNDASLEMTAFYRETIKKGNRNASLAEAVVKIFKTPYDVPKNDLVSLYKVRKSTDYKKLDTVALKLQGGPFNTLFVDIIKYPEYLFMEGEIDAYDFKYTGTKELDGKLLYQISFAQKPTITSPLYQGYLMIEPQKKTLHSASFNLNITDKLKASEMFVRRKPAKADVWPTNVNYAVNYQEKEGKWQYAYSQVNMEFKVDWQGKLFNSTYSMRAEMAVTDWDLSQQSTAAYKKEKIRESIILTDDATGFADPEFWGAYNIIEPEKPIENAIRKIQRQMKKGG